MPSGSERQRRFMAACADPEQRKKMDSVCPPERVAREFRRSDRGRPRKPRKPR